MHATASRRFRLEVETLEQRWVPSGGLMQPLVEPLPAAAFAHHHGGNVLPPTARPHDTSLADMARATALFNTSGNNLADYPQTPFQILYVDPSTVSVSVDSNGVLQETGTNNFTVRPGTEFYVPLAFVDDSPPILGTFPTNRADAVNYFFAHDQLGTANLTLAVDGESTSIGSSYLAGPVQTPPLLDGGGTHIITVGAFLTPMTPGTHTVEIAGDFAGALYVGFIGSPLHFHLTYTVTVSPT
jgi:hypothetical protein